MSKVPCVVCCVISRGIDGGRAAFLDQLSRWPRPPGMPGVVLDIVLHVEARRRGVARVARRMTPIALCSDGLWRRRHGQREEIRIRSAVHDPDVPLTIHSEVWIERAGAVALSAWRVALLESVHTHGSLTRAGEDLGVPYRTVRDRFKKSESALGIRLLETQSGR